jgi:hypothetical protein
MVIRPAAFAQLSSTSNPRLSTLTTSRCTCAGKYLPGQSRLGNIKRHSPSFRKGKLTRKSCCLAQKILDSQRVGCQGAYSIQIVRRRLARLHPGPADLAGTHAAIASMMACERMQFAVRYKNQSYDTAVSFAAQLSSTELTPLAACIDGLVARMQSDAIKSGG